MKSVKERFELKFHRTDKCWNWIGSKNSYGYGIFWYNKKRVGAHRVSYEIYKGPIHENSIILHSCDNPSCVNPDHLSIGTHNDNAIDRKNKLRGQFGSKHWNSKITESDILIIKSRYNDGESQSSISKDYNVTRTTIHNIVKNKFWKHLY